MWQLSDVLVATLSDNDHYADLIDIRVQQKLF